MTATLDLLCPDAPVELRVLHDRNRITVRRFTNHIEARVWALSFPLARGVYVVLNPFDASRIKGTAVDDGSITRRRWLLVDVDPERPTDTNSTNAELARAVSIAGHIKSHLRTNGWTVRPGEPPGLGPSRAP